MKEWIAILLLCLSVAAAQDTRTATLVGTVTDSTGALMPGAKVTITNTQTGFVSTGQTNAEGSYYLPYLAVGAYELTVEAAGFKKYLRSGISLRAGEMPRLDVQLEVGGLTESVSITGSAALLETETAVVGMVAEAKALIQLPLPQLRPLRILYYMPGVVPVSGGQSVMGQSDTQMGFMLDGISAKESIRSAAGDNAIVTGTMDAYAEVKLWTTGAPAELGHVAGGMVSLTLKSGTNQFHGALEDRYQNRVMIHRQYFEQFSRVNPFTYHEIQATLSGPVYIPKIFNGKNKTFFLFGYGRHHEKSEDPVTATVPTPEMLAGDFNFPGGAYPLYDPATIRQDAKGTWISDPLPGNKVPLNRFDQVTKNFLAKNPWKPPNTGGWFDRTGPHDNLNGWTFYRSYRSRYDAKIDHQFNSNHKISGRYSQMRHRQLGRVNIALAWREIDTTAPSFGIRTPNDQRNSVFSDYYTINPSTMNELRLGFNRRHLTNIPTTLNQGWAQKLGIPNVGPDNFPAFSGIYGLGALQYSSSISEDFTFQDNFTKIVRRHTFKTGYEVIRTRQNNVSPGNPSGTYNFGATSLPFTPNTGNSFASFLLGSVTSASFNTQLANYLPRWWSHAVYFQDDFRPFKGLTLNLGLRWSYESPFSTKWGFQSQFDPNVKDPLTGQMGAITHPKGALYKRDLNNFQPRLGLAWNFRPKLVFRASFGLLTTDMLASAGTEEYSAQAQVQLPTGDPRPVFYLAQGPPLFKYNLNADGTAVYLGTNYSSRGATWMDPNLRVPYIMNWSGGVQWEFAPTWLADLTYQGSAAVGLRSSVSINQLPKSIYDSKDIAFLDRVYSAQQNYRPYTQFGSISYQSNAGHDTYHALTTRAEKRYSPAGITLNTFWTWGRTLSGGTGDGWAYYNWSLTKGRTSYDRHHRIVEVLTVDLPFGKGRKFMSSGGLKNHILGGWNVVLYQTWMSGPPVSFGMSGSPYRYLSGPSRPNQLVPDDKVRTPNWELGPNRFPMTAQNPLFDINAFAYPAAYTPGTVGSGTQSANWLYGPQYSMSKSWSFKERVRFILRLDATSVPTRPILTSPNSTVNLTNPASFGKFNPGLGFDSIASPNGNLVLALRLEW